VYAYVVLSDELIVEIESHVDIFIYHSWVIDLQRLLMRVLLHLNLINACDVYLAFHGDL